ncbi:MAG: hypothetical protein HFI09_05405 [Bacilli bacterium]|nr:hypothetical protein [Bacilli bacterium]
MKKFIRHQNNVIFVSDNNFKEFEILHKESIEAKEETNQDTIIKVKLRYDLKNEKKAKIIINELNKIRKAFNLEKKDGYGSAFEIFAISVLYNIDYQETYDNFIVTGNNDGKVDAIYWYGKECILYQIKLGTCDTEIKTIINKNHLEFLSENTITDNNTSDLLNFYQKHKNEIKEKNFVIKTISQNLKSKNNITPMEIIEIFFENKIINQKNHLVLKLNVPKKTRSDESTTFLLAQSKNGVYAYFMSAEKLINELLNCSGIKSVENIHKFFSENVRGDLGPNKNMIDTIKNNPKNFVKYNNGITIMGNVDYKEDIGLLMITNPIINNGQQTLWNLIMTKESLKDIEVLVMIKNDSKPSVKDKIARFTNEQRQIKPVDLYSLDENLRNIQVDLYKDKDFREEIFLNINSSGKKQYDKIIKEIYTSETIIQLDEFCRLYFSTEDNQVGRWKNNISKQIELVLNESPKFDIAKTKEVCRIIKTFKTELKKLGKEEKQDLKAADLATMYIMFVYKKTFDEALRIIGNINRLYFYEVPLRSRKSKLIDLYKTNGILTLIQKEVKSFVTN